MNDSWKWIREVKLIKRRFKIEKLNVLLEVEGRNKNF